MAKKSQVSDESADSTPGATPEQLRAQADQMEADAVAQAEADRVAALSDEERAAEEEVRAKVEADRKLREEPEGEQLTDYVGLLSSDDVLIEYRKVGAQNAKERRLLLDGQNYEHAREDAAGRWLYRPMR